MDRNQYRESLKQKMDNFIHAVYDLSKNFPQEEKYGITSQLRRSAISVILNYVEGFARMKKLVQRNFLEISYGSLKEAKYLIYFCFKEGYLNDVDYNKIMAAAEEIGAMLWTEIKSLSKIKVK